MKFNCATTVPVNPPSASPVLTHAQVWKGFVKKCRSPEEFVPAIFESEILEEHDSGLTRRVTFKPGMGPPAGKATEIITYHGQTTASFRMVEEDTFITNTISTSPSGELYMTYTFEWDFPSIQSGTKEAEEKEKEIEKMSAAGVPHVLDRIRSMVRDGQL
ncbi:hypothetical protein BOTBODRAFT_115704 [Botryobasidium botryosum FD-172 SS1]|uniref:DUF1857-domain-containing protein n=1 Tax=Botryobasidium botryosum (strain FD-172 SS1) TaxID=930990 RepID=A0A067MF38_BOTB1|nr:hypothetical protein BOTBODRAFT_115704 [Botryobasidium botryosum FD-172 SS1]